MRQRGEAGRRGRADLEAAGLVGEAVDVDLAELCEPPPQPSRLSSAAARATASVAPTPSDDDPRTPANVARGIQPETVQVQPDAAATAELASLAAAGELSINIDETLPLARFRDGYARLERGGLRGKIVLMP